MSKKFTYFGSFPSWAYLIDLFPSITMAFDFRKLRSAYSGNAIRVLRTSDNTEKDFGFLANEVVGSDIIKFVGWNLFNYSEQIQQTAWSKNNTTAVADAIIAPDGTMTGDVVFETTSNTTHSVSRVLQVISGKEYSVSFWVNPQGRDTIIVRATTLMSTDGISTPSATFDLTTGTKTADNGFFRVAPTITLAPNGWFLITYGLISSTNTATGVMTVFFNSTSAYVGDITKGVAIWGSQVSESNSFLTYQKTEATAMGYGSISKGYDQASGGDDVINATIIRQPIIVNGGNLITDGGKLALQGGSTLGLRSTSIVALSGYTDLFFTFGLNINNITTGQILLETSTSVSSNIGAIQIGFNSGNLTLIQRVSASLSTQKTYPISTGRQLITVRFRSGQTATNASQVWINGTEITGTVVLNNPSVSLSNQVVYLFARAGNSIGFLGKYQNFTMFTDLVQRAGIENNINDYYGYY
jgi:hypothetical protein